MRQECGIAQDGTRVAAKYQSKHVCVGTDSVYVFVEGDQLHFRNVTVV